MRPMRLNGLLRFARLCRNAGYSKAEIRKQWRLFRDGIRDHRLCDNAIVLIDAYGYGYRERPR